MEDLRKPVAATADIQNIDTDLLQDLRRMIEDSRSNVASVVNSALTLLYWQVGNRINTEILKGERAEYGKQIVNTLSSQLSQEYGRGFTEKNLRRMLQFEEIFPEKEIVVSLVRQLSWTHFTVLIPIKDPLSREFYTQMCQLEKWSVRTLRQQIDSMLFERTALSKKPQKLIEKELGELKEHERLTSDLVFKDPYVLDFLELNDHYYEKDLEDAILREMEKFLLELGVGFSFIARQKRLQIDNEDFYIDLLFYNRKLKRLIAIDLKLSRFKAAYKGQMELYLRWLAKYEQEEGEQPPLGIILCAEKQEEQIELLELGRSGIHVAEYLTVLPPRKVLQEKLHKAIEISRQRLEKRKKNARKPI